MHSVLVAVPALNEEGTIASVVREVRTALPGADVVVVDDGSTDATAEQAAAAGATVLAMPFNVGVGGALRAAFLYARDHGHDAVLQIDGDGQHDPRQAGHLLQALEDGASVVVGSRFLAATDAYRIAAGRRMAMRVLGRLVSAVVGTRLTDTTSGLRAADRKAIMLFAQHYPAEWLGDTVESLVLASKAGLTITEVPITMRQRQGGSPSQGSLRSVLYFGRAIMALGVAVARPRPDRAR